LHPGSAGSRAAPILFTTLPGDPHDLGALMAAVIAADIGARAIFVGGALPVEEIAIASERTGAAAVVLGSSYDAGGALHSLRALRAQLPAAVDLWIGGETEHLAGKVAGVVYLADLVELERKVTLFCERRP
jgi:methylmalonyl-CoA mutase cobalamin-binding subunit